jgi:hypothetical protein
MAAIAILDGEAEELTRLCIEMAKEGDMTAMRLVVERRVSQRPVEISLPKISVTSDLIAAASALTDAVATGDITPGEAASLSMLIGNVAKAVEVCELADRLSKLEEQITAKGSNP